MGTFLLLPGVFPRGFRIRSLSLPSPAAALLVTQMKINPGCQYILSDLAKNTAAAVSTVKDNGLSGAKESDYLGQVC